MTSYRCPACRSQPRHTARNSHGLRICARCGLPLEPLKRAHPLRALAALALFAALGAAAITAFSSTQAFNAQPRPSDRPLKPADDSSLMAALDQADEGWRPRAQLLPNGGTRYTYKRRQDDPPLSIEQIKLLIRFPPRFERERAAITALLGELRSRGVLVVLGPPRKAGAAGEWEPRAGIVRIRPDVPAKGSREFAKVLNHESIHVAQSCRSGGLRARPQPLGLPVVSQPSTERFLSSPVYAGLSATQQLLEREAYSNQKNLELGVSLVRGNCRR
ncbi:hypothetical protein [Cyanobium sp. Morenito 9A2]|uniref:hypothetical protein n=1 Tax=Cyanobium sp. Morenito 9A2 TaxID=2823718 RepID=UPI0020CBB406|nr:hypothetical protein [Cyanobium sp. Morenito 9A2]MCP9848697.1 hypothetical protein [Cyanobium sp. Morenito 9A2]